MEQKNENNCRLVCLHRVSFDFIFPSIFLSSLPLSLSLSLSLSINLVAYLIENAKLSSHKKFVILMVTL